MATPEIVCCADDYFCQIIYSLAAYIVDYSKQALLAYIMQGWYLKYTLLFSFICYLILFLSRCTANQHHLDDGGRCWSHEHTELLVCELELGVL